MTHSSWKGMPKKVRRQYADEALCGLEKRVDPEVAAICFAFPEPCAERDDMIVKAITNACSRRWVHPNLAYIIEKIGIRRYQKQGLIHGEARDQIRLANKARIKEHEDARTRRFRLRRMSDT
jgi:hypothetical protein